MDSKNNPGIGAVYTPLAWALWMTDRFQLTEKWLQGQRVLDPTCGEGVFLEALIRRARDQGRIITAGDLNRLQGVDKEQKALNQLTDRLLEQKLLSASEIKEMGLFCGDITQVKNQPYAEILVGNPPWINFCDIPAEEKEQWRPLFLSHGLAASSGKLLLGSSRIDLSALILQILVDNALAPPREALFFLPQSLFFDGGAHTLWRKHFMNHFPLQELYLFDRDQVFPGISTKYTLARFFCTETDKGEPRYHLPQGKQDGKEPESILWISRPLHTDKDQNLSYFLKKLPTFSLPLRPRQRPRQGLNTGGANKLYFFSRGSYNSHNQFQGINGWGEEVILPGELVFPALSSCHFQEPDREPEKWVFIPHDNQQGKPLSEEDLRSYNPGGVPLAANYLQEKKESLTTRKGTLLGSSRKRGIWWNLLGVGPYTFAPWKVVWQAYGQNRFKAVVLSSYQGRLWQPHQALHCFIPCQTEDEAAALADQLNGGELEEILRAQRGEGNRNWAQPGKIIPWVRWITPQETLFPE